MQRRLTFPLGGPDETPGVIVMCLDGTGLDPRWRTSWWSSSTRPSTTTTQAVPDLAGAHLHLHPELTASADPAPAHAPRPPTGDLTVPARSVAVFVADR